MQTPVTYCPIRRWLLIAVTCCALGPAGAGWAAAGTKRVLVLYSTSHDAPMAIAGDGALPRILEQGVEEDVTYYSEYIDQGRFPDAGYLPAFSDFLRVKYKGQRFDLVIAIQAGAVDFVNQRRNELFPDTSVVFLSLSPLTQRLLNSTGVIANLDLASTLALAVALQPDIRHVFVVSGAGVPGRTYERQTRVQLQPFESKLTITYLSGLITKDLEARLATLPDHSIVYYLVVYQDGAGRTFGPRAYSERVAAAARAPTYTWSDALMGHGVVGGSLLDRQAMMEAVGQLGVRVLRGERADSIPTSSPNLNVSQVDWRQLRRWGINEARLPAGTLVRFKEFSVWDRYKVYILGALALLLAQTALIGGLLIQRRRRRQAEEHVRGSQAELRTSDERIRDLGARLLNAQDTERSRIARELHDDISQQVALLTIDLELLTGTVQTESEELVHEALHRAEGIAKTVHDLSHRLHPTKLRLIGLIPALHALQRELSRPEIIITFTHDNIPPSVPPDLTLCLFRIVQEALQNAVKHSKAHEVSVHLHGGPDGLALTIADDGVGFEVDRAVGKGLGLISIRERLEAVSGTLEIRSKPGAGTQLDVQVPLRVVHSAEPFRSDGGLAL
jgi:signal transduction histidine kinase